MTPAAEGRVDLDVEDERPVLPQRQPQETDPVALVLQHAEQRVRGRSSPWGSSTVVVAARLRAARRPRARPAPPRCGRTASDACAATAANSSACQAVARCPRAGRAGVGAERLGHACGCAGRSRARCASRSARLGVVGDAPTSTCRQPQLRAAPPRRRARPRCPGRAAGPARRPRSLWITADGVAERQAEVPTCGPPAGRLLTHTVVVARPGPVGAALERLGRPRVVVITAVLPTADAERQLNIRRLGGPGSRIEVVPGALGEDPHGLGGHRSRGAGQFAVVDPVRRPGRPAGSRSGRPRRRAPGRPAAGRSPGPRPTRRPVRG